MKKVAVFGGAFDPPHIGHVSVVKYLREELGMVIVEVVPSGNHLHKESSTASYDERTAMVEIAFSEYPSVLVTSMDAPRVDDEREGTGSTYNLMRNISIRRFLQVMLDQQSKECTERMTAKEMFDEEKLYCVIGQDNAESIESFYRWEDLICRYKFIVIPREGCSEDGKWYNSAPHIFASGFKQVDISSTKIRNSLDNGLLPQGVPEYIQRHELYGFIK